MRISDWSSDVCSSDLDEQVRTLWSNDGSRLTVYCAKVNANNIMGGKTGFKPLTLIIDAVHKKPGTTDLTQKVWAKGQIFINDDINPNFYLECMRPDTERANGKIFLVYQTMARPWNDGRSAERRVGNECVSTVRYRWLP